MPRPARVRPEVFMFQALWRKAVLAPEPVVLTLPTPRLALRARMQLYNALRDAHRGDKSDPLLLRAWENMEVLRGEDPCSLILQRRTDGVFGQCIAQAMGANVEDLSPSVPAPAPPPLSAELLALVDSEASPDSPVPSPSANPYYTR